MPNVLTPVRFRPISHHDQLSVVDHLEELRTASRLSAAPQDNRPVTLGIGEPFTSTLTVTLIFALILSLPVLLLQAYGFLIPALAPEQRPTMLPITLAIPGFEASVLLAATG
jgi:sec-independent protein translocase protein TatC